VDEENREARLRWTPESFGAANPAFDLTTFRHREHVGQEITDDCATSDTSCASIMLAPILRKHLFV
jgi:hypothetical protein